MKYKFIKAQLIALVERLWKNKIYFGLFAASAASVFGMASEATKVMFAVLYFILFLQH